MRYVIPLALAAVSALTGQNTRTPAPDLELRLGARHVLAATIQTEATLLDVIGPDAGEVVRGAIGHFPNIVGLEPRLVMVVEEQLPANWLPPVKGVTFQRFSVKWEGWKVDCVRALWLEMTRADDRLDVTVKEGNQCRTTGITVVYTRDGQRWKKNPGAGGGSRGGASHCQCE